MSESGKGQIVPIADAYRDAVYYIDSSTGIIVDSFRSLAAAARDLPYELYVQSFWHHHIHGIQWWKDPVK